MDAAQFAGRFCARTYVKELETRYRDCLTFYLDGRVHFERYCYGEAAGLVFHQWASGLDDEGRLLWEGEPASPSLRQALPQRLTEVQEEGAALRFDGERRRFLRAEELTCDRENGYGRWKLFWLRRRLAKNA